ncbi:MAG TPA: ABC transporter substrate-binding protein [Miltoncostaeaceae bacterium]|jgi:polar amino acid transport system substrate-binding protein|nr:ABC transporter substrate-binding protein [Miltoncostaeaceae bacterium]
MRRLRLLSLLAALALAAGLLLAACGDDDDDASAGATDAQTSAAVCTKDTLQTKAAGTLTVATDSPAFPPYVIDDDPANGKGFESAVAYAIADQLGFAQDEVKWVRVPFNSTFAPGPKKYDFDVNQVSINAQRQKGADFSSPYYTTPQGVLVAGDSSFASATTLAELKDAQIGVQVGTTSLDAVNEVIAPSKQPRVYDTSTDVVRALKNGQVDAIVTDLPTTIYLRDAEVEGSKLVGQFAAPGGDDWGAVLQKDSPLTECVTQAIDALRDSGELQRITDEWIGAEAPELS